MNIKQIILMAGIGLIFFALSFTVGLFTRTKEDPAANGPVPNGAEVVETMSGTGMNPPVTSPGIAAADTDSSSFVPKSADLDKSLTEKQLQNLILDMQAKMADMTVKEKSLSEKEARVQLAMDDLQEKINQMEDLRTKLAAQLSSIKAQQTILDNKLITIEEAEKVNILKTAAIYDKMKSADASEIVVNLYKSNQLDYAVKIAYYMTERTSANLLAEVAKNEPALAAEMSNRLRLIKENSQ